MTRFQLNQAVSRRTGDDHSVILQRGFSLVDDASPLLQEDFDALIADWDRIQDEELVDSWRHSSTNLTFPRSVRTRGSKTKSARTAKQARANNRPRRSVDTAH